MRFGECDSEHRSSLCVGVLLCIVVYAPTGPGVSFSETPLFRLWIRKCMFVCVCVEFYGKSMQVIKIVWHSRMILESVY